MKKNKNIIFLIFLLSIFLVFLSQFKFTKTASIDQQNIDTIGEPHQKPKIQVSDILTKSSEPTKPFANEKLNAVLPPPVVKHEFTATELKEIQKMRNQAKMTLAINYTTMMAFKAEWNRYTTDLRSAGFTPNKSELSYKLGFINQFHPENDVNIDTNEDFHSTKNLTTDTFIGENDSQSEQVFRYAPGVENINLNEYSRYCKKGCSASAKQFEIILVLPLPNSNKVDIWTVNGRKVIEQVLDGTQ